MWISRLKRSQQRTSFSEIKQLPVASTVVYLDSSGTDEQIRLALSKLPRTVREVSFSNNWLNHRSAESIKLILSGLSPTVTHVDLTANDLAFSAPSKLKIAFSGIPSTVTHIDLSQNGFGLYSAEGLKEAFSELPSSVVNISFEKSRLLNKTKQTLKEWFSGLPRCLEQINLAETHLGDIINEIDNEEEYDELMSDLPPNLTYINLSNNGLGNLTGKKLKRLLSALPANTTFVDLSGALDDDDDLDKVNEWVSGLAGSITHFNLSNCLKFRRLDDLTKIISSLPINITYVDLSYNHFFMHSTTQIIQLLKSIPSLITVNLSNNLLLKNRPEEDCKAILEAVRADYHIDKDLFIVRSSYSYLRAILAVTSLVIKGTLPAAIACLIVEFTFPNSTLISTDIAKYYQRLTQQLVSENTQNRNRLFFQQEKNVTICQSSTCAIQ